MKLFVCLLILLMCSPLTLARQMQDNSSVPPLTISDKGELNYDHNKFSYTRWDSTQLIGKVRVVQYLAARTSVQKMTASLIKSITAAGFSPEHYQTTTIINTADAIVGTGWLASMTIKNNKKEFSRSQIIVDDQGIGAKRWQLSLKSAHVIVLDRCGIIRYRHTGLLSEAEVRQVLSLVRQLVQSDVRIRSEKVQSGLSICSAGLD